MKYKKDDKIKITGNSNHHSYNIWEECYIIWITEIFYETSRDKWWKIVDSGYIIDNDCELVGNSNRHPYWMLVWVSDKCQEDADEDYNEYPNQNYVWREMNWHYVTEYDWFLLSWKYISIKEEIPEYTMEQLIEKIWNFKLIK